MRDIVLVLMEGNFIFKIKLRSFNLQFFCILGVPSNVSYVQVVEDLLQLPGVRNAHSLHIWSLSVQRAALSVHIAIGE
jgi:Co/Zn/Cd efflux system component